MTYASFATVCSHIISEENMSAESSCLFKKGNWNVNTKDEMSNVLVVAVPVRIGSFRII